MMIEINQIRRHYLGLTENEINKYVYRIFPIYRFIELIEKSTNTLVKPHKWDDPFENFILNGYQKFNDGEFIPLQNLANKMYGQCWSFKKESDALWRVYSQKRNGIKVRSTPKKLLVSLKNGINDDCSDVTCFIGKVKYFQKRNITKLLKTIKIMSNDGSGPAKTMLVKRETFGYEKELRIIYYPLDSFENDLFHYKIDPNYVFDELIMDPRMNANIFLKYKNEIERLGFKGKISKSSLYEPPKNIFING